jgi:hypothetical protein
MNKSKSKKEVLGIAQVEEATRLFERAWSTIGLVPRLTPASRQRKRSWAFKRPALARMGTPHNVQAPKDGLPRCKQRELRAYLRAGTARAKHVAPWPSSRPPICRVVQPRASLTRLPPIPMGGRTGWGAHEDGGARSRIVLGVLGHLALGATAPPALQTPPR